MIVPMNSLNNRYVKKCFGLLFKNYNCYKQNIYFTFFITLRMESTSKK